MKRLLALFIALGVAVTLYACGSNTSETTEATSAAATDTSSEPAEGKEAVLGTLSMLNMSEEDYRTMVQGRFVAGNYLLEQGVLETTTEAKPLPEVTKVVYYDTLDALLMALEAGDIIGAEVPRCTADYLCAHNDRLVANSTYNLDKADDFTKDVAYRLGVGYSFLMTENNTELRDKLDQAISKMKEDGTLDALVKTYITDAANTDPKPVELPKTDGETVRIAVTGSLPPMDYVAADGTPAGFNTALLAELGKRLGVNFELVQVDSVGRAAALSSGQVDLVFWTSGGNGERSTAGMTDEERTEYWEEMKDKLTEEQIELIKSMNGGLGREVVHWRDAPEGTIATQPYYSDLSILVVLK